MKVGANVHLVHYAVTFMAFLSPEATILLVSTMNGIPLCFVSYSQPVKFVICKEKSKIQLFPTFDPPEGRAKNAVFVHAYTVRVSSSEASVSNLVPRGRVPLVPCGRETRASGINHFSATFDGSKIEHEQ